MSDLNEALIAFKKTCNEAQKHWGESKDKYSIDYTVAKKYAKFIVTSWGQNSVFAFVDLSNGDIFKPAGWNAPAKQARGNIYSPQNGAEAFQGQFIRYLRG